MDNPDDSDDDERTVINVKGVPQKAWNAARNAAKRQDEAMGVWLAKAITTQVNLEAGPREFPPLPPVKNAPEMGNPSSAKAKTFADADAPESRAMTVEQLGVLMHGLAAVATATGTPPAKADIRRLYHLADEHVRQARGLPPRPVRGGFGKEQRQSFAVEGKAHAALPDAAETLPLGGRDRAEPGDGAWGGRNGGLRQGGKGVVSDRAAAAEPGSGPTAG